MAEAIPEHNLETITTTAHKIKGAALSVGAARIAAASEDIELAANSGNFKKAQQLLTILEEELDTFKACIQI